MGLGSKPLVLPASDVVVTPADMAEADHDVFAAKREELGTGHVVIGLGPLPVGPVEGVQVFPVNAVGRLEQKHGVALVRNEATADAVPGVAFFPNIWRVIAVLPLARDGLGGDDRVGGVLGPVLEEIVVAGCQAGLPGVAPVSDGRFPIPDETVTTPASAPAIRRVRFRFQRPWVEGPVHQVGAGRMAERRGCSPWKAFVCDVEDVKDMMPALPEKVAVRIERAVLAVRDDEVVAGKMRGKRSPIFRGKGPLVRFLSIRHRGCPQRQCHAQRGGH